MVHVELTAWIIKLSLCDVQIVPKENIIVVETEVNAAARPADRNNKSAIFKNVSPFTDFLNETNYTQVNNAKNINALMSMYNILECSNGYSKTSRSLRGYYREKTNDDLADS